MVGAALMGAALAGALAACGGESDPARPQNAELAAVQSAVPEAIWNELVRAEELLHALRPKLRRLERAVRNLQLPDPGARGLFAVAVTATDLAGGDVDPGGESDLHAFQTLAIAAPDPPVAPTDLSLWAPLFAGLDRVERASLAPVRGRFLSDERFETDLWLRGLGRDTADRPVALEAHARVVWARRPAADPSLADSWRITDFATRSARRQRSGGFLFREVLDAVLPDPAARTRARTSVHEDLAVQKLTDPDGFRRPHPHFFLGSQDRHPGISVVDIDGNGFDDLYVMARWGPNQLLWNRGDGHFDERAEALGLAVRDHSAAAIFADFDNDGDPDAFVGRTLAPSVYLENRDGRFVDRTAEAIGGGTAPTLVSAVSAADVDGDGLLDLYVSTYAAQMLVAERMEAHHQAQQSGANPPRHLLSEHLSPADAAQLHTLAGEPETHLFMALPGPPNVLLRNRGGGRFEVDASAGPLRAFRNTYQATWSDYDDDGDPDVYLAHDFAPNQLLRNDGSGSFADVTAETETADIGFGMGASWGDYDRDGRLDLYVSNMYSKAGRRITEQLEGLDPRFRKMARGNTLFRNEGERFRSVSGTAPPALLVENAEWAWGGQFADFDNDGFLDVYALSGYYTAPLEAHVDVDI